MPTHGKSLAMALVLGKKKRHRSPNIDKTQNSPLWKARKDKRGRTPKKGRRDQAMEIRPQRGHGLADPIRLRRQKE